MNIAPSHTVISAILLAPIACADQVVFVDAALATGANDGSSWANAFRGTDGLQAALTAPHEDPVQIWIANGTYRPGPPGSPTSVHFAVSSGVALYGGFAGGERSLDERNPALHPAILTGDILGNDVPAANAFWQNTQDNAKHVVRLVEADSTAILDGLVIRRGNADNEFWPDGRGGNVFVQRGSPTIAGCRIMDGYSDKMGGGISIQGGSAHVVNCEFRKNRAGFLGSALHAFGGSTAVIEGCLFIENVGGSGVGIGVGTMGFGGQPDVSSDLVVRDCRFQANGGPIGASSGIGMFIDGGASTVERCAFVGNTTQAGGGGVYLHKSGAHFDACDFVGNEGAADGGGGFYVDGGNIQGPPSPLVPTFRNCRFVGNNGAGFCNFGGHVEVVNCTMVHGKSVNFFLTWPTFFVGADSGAVLRNCVVWGNAPATTGGPTVLSKASNGSYDVQYCTVQAWNGSMPGVGCNGLDPLLVDFNGPDNIKGNEDDDARLTATSPCVDSGDSSALSMEIVEDFDGLPRRVDDPATPDSGAGPGPAIDRGCHEFQPLSPADLDGDGDVDGGDLGILLGNWGTRGAGDIDGDGDVDGADLGLLLGAWG